jgi:Fe-S-cluster containining protein
LSDENKTSAEKDRKSKNEQKETQSRYVFECQKCGECCKKRDSIVISLADLSRWNRDLTLPSLYPYLTIEMVNNSSIQILLKKTESEDEKSQKGCPLYDDNNKICNIYFSKPLFCSSFPLGFDGKNFFIKDKNCPGIGKGKMTDDTLKKAREMAKEDFEARVDTSMLLPIIHGLTLGLILDQSKKRIDELSPEQKEKLTKMFAKDKEANEGE